MVQLRLQFELYGSPTGWWKEDAFFPLTKSDLLLWSLQ